MSFDTNIQCKRHGKDHIKSIDSMSYCETCVLDIAEGLLPSMIGAMEETLANFPDFQEKVEAGEEDKDVLYRKLSVGLALNLHLFGTGQLEDDQVMDGGLFSELEEKLKAS